MNHSNLLILCIIPFLYILFHEMLHLIFRIKYNVETEKVIIGNKNKKLIYSFILSKRLNISMDFHLGFGGEVSPVENTDRHPILYQRVLIIFGGPISDIIVGIFTYFSFHLVSNLYVLIVSIFIAISNLIPYRKGEYRSDGYRLMQILLKKCES